MQHDISNQDEVQIVRYAPSTSRPHTPQQTSWRGPLPHGVKHIVERAALDRFFSKSYAKWASSFAMLTNEFVADALQRAPEQAVPTPDWTFYKFVDCGSCRKGNEYVWVQKHDSGWTIELCYPDNADPDAR